MMSFERGHRIPVGGRRSGGFAIVRDLKIFCSIQYAVKSLKQVDDLGRKQLSPYMTCIG